MLSESLKVQGLELDLLLAGEEDPERGEAAGEHAGEQNGHPRKQQRVAARVRHHAEVVRLCGWVSYMENQPCFSSTPS